MKDRFNLEDEINMLYSFSDQLGTLSEAIVEETLTKDETVNAIQGLRVMINLQVAKLQDTLSQCFKLDNYRDEVTY